MWTVAAFSMRTRRGSVSSDSSNPSVPRLALDRTLRRAVVLMGPRRVGKTVMLHQTIQHLLDRGTDARSLLYVSLDTPSYSGLGLDRLLQLFWDACGGGPEQDSYIFFDE